MHLPRAGAVSFGPRSGGLGCGFYCGPCASLLNCLKRNEHIWLRFFFLPKKILKSPFLVSSSNFRIGRLQNEGINTHQFGNLDGRFHRMDHQLFADAVVLPFLSPLLIKSIRTQARERRKRLRQMG